MKTNSKKVIKKQQTKKRDIDFDSLQWQKDASGSQTWDFGTNPEFVGEFLRTEERKGKLKKGEKGKPKNFTVNIFLDSENSEQALPDNYQIKEAIKKHGHCYYKIIFLQQKKIAGGHKVSQFEIHTAKG